MVWFSYEGLLFTLKGEWVVSRETKEQNYKQNVTWNVQLKNPVKSVQGCVVNTTHKFVFAAIYSPVKGFIWFFFCFFCVG